MFRNSKSLLRSKAGNYENLQTLRIQFAELVHLYLILGKSKGTIIDIPGKLIEPTPISQPSNSQETSGSNREVVRGGDSEKSRSRQSTPIIPSSLRSQEKNSNNAINDSVIAVMDIRKTITTHNIQ